MSQSMSSSRVRRLTGLFALLALLGAVLSSAQSTAAHSAATRLRGESSAPVQITPGYALPVARVDAGRGQYDDPHHDYPAIDIEVPVGTPVYAVRQGTVQRIYQADGCGLGYVVTATDGGQYTYCHLSKYYAASGTTVNAGRMLGWSGNTGRSDGPHVHVQLRVNGSLRCPQPLLLAIWDGAPAPALSSLPTSGCTY